MGSAAKWLEHRLGSLVDLGSGSSSVTYCVTSGEFLLFWEAQFPHL